MAGGLGRAVSYMDSAGAEAVQVFVSNPRGWALARGDQVQDELFRAGVEEREVLAYIHATLLVNLGSPTEETVLRSALTLAHALDRAAAIGARGVVFHAGSAVAPGRTAAALRQVREVLPPLLDKAGTLGCRLLVEPSAGGGQSLASRMDQLGEYFDAVDRHPALGACFDTCHAWAAGHDLASPGGMSATVDALLDACGPERLGLVHANDAKDPRGSTRDRHENVGAGAIGSAAFAELLAHPALTGVPVIVETPSEAWHGHARDIATLKTLRPAGTD